MESTRMELSVKCIDEIVARLSQAYNPLAIYLFGSQAWGEPDDSSDIDLLIVVEDSELDAAERIRVGLKALKGIKIDIELLVFTRAELEEKSEHPASLACQVLRKGVKLYEAA